MEFPVFNLAQQANTFGSNRFEAVILREQLEDFLQRHQSATLDFVNVPAATQSWVDELLGRFVLREGAGFTKRVKFKNCTPMMQGLIRFVVVDRVRDHEKAHQRCQSTMHHVMSGRAIAC